MTEPPTGVGVDSRELARSDYRTDPRWASHRELFCPPEYAVYRTERETDLPGHIWSPTVPREGRPVEAMCTRCRLLAPVRYLPEEVVR